MENQAERIPRLPAPLLSLLDRLDQYSQQPDFRLQRELAFAHFLKPYVSYSQGASLRPLPAEIELAKLYVYCDYLPNDGHLSLVEQARDEIAQHIPEEERAWLDPLRHSFMDLLEIIALGTSGSPHEVQLKSLGDAIEYRVTSEELAEGYKVGHVLLTRLFRRPELTVFPGVAVGLSPRRGRQVYDYVRDLQREMEAESGVFELGEWQEFTKRYGHVLIWALAQLRWQWILEVEDHIAFQTPDHQPYLFCIGIYEHHEPKFIQQMIQESGEWDHDPLEHSVHPDALAAKGSERLPLSVWIKQSREDRSDHPVVTSRLTITPTQIFAEAGSLDDYNDVKHFLASTFGFSIHFKGEITEPPFHTIPPIDLLSDEMKKITPLVSKEEEHQRLAQLLESVYLEWAEHPCPALHQHPPRQYVRKEGGKVTVSKLIDELERYDLAFLRTGKRGYDYSALREHVGLEE